jgi:MFS family permease
VSGRRPFYGWWVAAACFCTFGIAVGIPYYALPFFYDYFELSPAKGGFGWSRSIVTLGFPLATVLTVWAGPLLVQRWNPRRVILVGTATTALALVMLSLSHGQLWLYFLFWILFMIGYICSGPIPHQILIARWFGRMRGRAMGVMYTGVGLAGAISAKYIARPLTEAFGFRVALAAIGISVLLSWPIVLAVIRNDPSEMGLHMDGEDAPPKNGAPDSHGYAQLVRQRAFWLLLVGSFCSIGAIGAINQHMKLIFKDVGFYPQSYLNFTFGQALFAIMASSISGRLLVGWLADRYSNKWLTVAMYALVAASVLLLLAVRPPGTPYEFAILFGLSMGADYMLIPLVAAEQLGAESISRVMAVIVPADMIGLTWFPFAVSALREKCGGYAVPLEFVFAAAVAGSVLMGLVPSAKKDGVHARRQSR